MPLPTRLFGRREFKLAHFLPRPLEFSAEPDELLLDRVVESLGGDSNVVALAQPLPTAGELRKSIERHLQATRGGASRETVPDPAEELRAALAELRRSLG